MWIFLVLQYLLLWVFVHSVCASAVTPCPTGLSYKSGCTKKKKKWNLVLPACVATVPTVFLRVAEVPRRVILFHHSFSWCMLLIFWPVTLAIPSPWTASLLCSCSAFTQGAAPWWNPKEGKVEAGGKKMWIKLLLGFFVHFSTSETPLTVPVSSHQPYIQSSSHPQYSFSCWCWPQLDYLACLLT